ncbi:MAG: hypothetical protein FWF27_00935 [Candidatus Bathyarchaeota archaeon]|nr:hypothetical protein [Candidatus Termiticorpusculum sp.]
MSHVFTNGSLSNIPLGTWITANDGPNDLIPTGQSVRFRDRAENFTVTTTEHQTMLNGANRLSQVHNQLSQINPNLQIRFIGVKWMLQGSTVTGYQFDVAVTNKGNNIYFGTLFDQLHDALNALQIHLPTLVLGNTEYYIFQYNPIIDLWYNYKWYIIAALIILIVIIFIVLLLTRSR